MANFMWRELKYDLLTVKMSVRKRIWAYSRGFFGITVLAYGLDDSNYKDYENDFHYYRLHGLNGRFAVWIDDKLTYKYILHPFDEYLPKYYFELLKGTVIMLMDCPKELSSDIASIVSLLEKEKHFAVKSVVGSGGVGFYKLSFDAGKYWANGQEMSVYELRALLETLHIYIVSEYIFSHESIRSVYPDIPSTLRVMTVWDDKEGTIIPGAYIRFATSRSGFSSRFTAGGILAGVDVKTGRIFGARSWKDGRIVDILVHPDTGLPIPGNVPHWDLITEKLKEIVDYVPQIKYMGFDVIVTDQGFRINEINSHQGLLTIQLFYPMMKNRYARKLFYGE
jgi:hypothetical protein